MTGISLYKLNQQKLSPLFYLLAVLLCTLAIPGTSFALGTVQGFVRDSDGYAISGALVDSTGGATDVTGSNGFYRMAHPAGSSETITASATGYDDQSKPVTVNEGETTLLDFSLPGSPLQIESVQPTLFKMGQSNNNVEIRGTDFNFATRLSMYLDSGNRSKTIGAAATPGRALSVAVSGNTAYVADQAGGLQVIDLHNPTQPKIIDSVPTSGHAEEVVVQGNTAYMTDWSLGSGTFYVIDIDPSSPKYLDPPVSDTMPIPNQVNGVAVAGDRAYLAAGVSGLHIIDIDPSSPDYLISKGSVSIDDAHDVTVVGDRAYVTDYGFGLRVIGIDPDNSDDFLQVIGSWEAEIELPVVNIGAGGIAISGDTAFIACNVSGLKVVNINPDSPDYLKEIGSVDTPGFSFNVSVIGDTAYVADFFAGLQIIDVSSPDTPVIRSSVGTTDVAYDVTVEGNTAFVANSDDGLQIIDVSDPIQTPMIGLVPIPGETNNVTVVGNLAYVAADSKGLQIVDIDPLSPDYLTIIGSVDTPEYAVAVTVSGNRAFVADYYSGLQIIDISDPRHPFIIDSRNLTGNTNDVKVVGDIAYVAASLTLSLININPLSGDYLSFDEVPTPDTAEAVAVAGDKAYVADFHGGLHIIDLDPSNPDSPEIIDSVPTLHQAHGVSIKGGNAYVADGRSGLLVININPLSSSYRQIVGSVDIPNWAEDVTIIGNTAYVSSNYFGFYTIDITNPTQPVIVGSMKTLSGSWGMNIAGDIAYVADKNAGLVIMPVPIELSSFYPNNKSTISATLPNPQLAGNYTIRVFNNEEYEELPGAVTFTNDINLLTSKAIIVAGGGPGGSGDIWEETKAYANYAYRSLVYQGYLDDDIYYMTDETGALGRDAPATKDNLKHAVTQWAKGNSDTSGLLMYLVDHGASGEFQIRGGTDIQNVSAFEIDSWLNTLQNTMKGKVVFIYDACKSGSFISSDSSAAPPRTTLLSGMMPLENPSNEESFPHEDLTVPGSNTLGNGSGNSALPAILLLLNASNGAKDRIIITSSASNQVAYFLNPTHSFSYHFWSILSGKTGKKANLLEAFTEASSTMSFYQTSQLDANGDGKANENEDFSALQELEGTIYALRRQYSSDLTKPVVGIISDDQTLNGTDSATLMARSVYDIDGDAIVRVWAEIIRPDYNPYQGDITVTDIPTVELTDPDDDRVYEGIYDKFDVVGPYIINYYAEDAHGIYSRPKTSIVLRQ